jgi:hypothetical protein
MENVTRSHGVLFFTDSIETVKVAHAAPLPPLHPFGSKRKMLAALSNLIENISAPKAHQMSLNRQDSLMKASNLSRVAGMVQ